VRWSTRTISWISTEAHTSIKNESPLCTEVAQKHMLKNEKFCQALDTHVQRSAAQTFPEIDRVCAVFAENSNLSELNSTRQRHSLYFLCHFHTCYAHTLHPLMQGQTPMHGQTLECRNNFGSSSQLPCAQQSESDHSTQV